MKRNPFVVAAACAASVLSLATASHRAAADAVVASATFDVPALAARSGIAFFNPVHVKRNDDIKPAVSGVTHFDDSVAASSGDPGGPSKKCSNPNPNAPIDIGPMQCRSSGRQRTDVTAGTDSAVVRSQATVAASHTRIPNNCFFGPFASALTRTSVAISITQRCHYHLVASLSGEADDPGALATATVALDGDGDDVSETVPGTGRSPQRGASVARDGVFEAGFVFLSIEATASLGDIGNFRSGSQARASWDVTLSLSADTSAGGEVRWTNRAGGGYGAGGNWDTGQVPVKDTSRADDAIFDLGAHYAVDFAAAAKAVGSQRAADRLLVLQGDVTFENANLKVDALPFDRPSLVLDTGRLTVASGQLTSNHAVIGDLHSVGALLTVDGPASRWDCLGELRVGGSGGTGGEGTLRVTGGAAMTSAATIVGAGRQTGFALASGDGTTWSTGNIAVAGSSTGRLTISDGAHVTSSQAFVGHGQHAHELANVVVTGVGAAGTASQWEVADLQVGESTSLNFVDVADGATLRADNLEVGTFPIGGGFVQVVGVHAAPETPSQLECISDVTVGRLAGTGVLAIAEGAQASLGGDLLIGSSGHGEVDVGSTATPATTASDLVVGGRITVGEDDGGVGDLEIGADGVVTAREVFLGTLPGSAGTVSLGSFGSLHVTGSMSAGSLGGVGLVSMTQGLLTVDGDLSVGPLGSLLGTGLVSVTGSFTVNGFVDPSLAQLGTEPTESPSKRGGGARRTPTPPAGGVLTLQGDLVLGPTGVLFVEAAGPESDRLVVQGDATLDGTLVLQFRDGFAPKAGDQFEVLHVEGATTGAFAAVETRGVAPGAQFDVAASAGALTLTATNDAVPLPVVRVRASTKRLLEKKAKKKATLTFSRTGSAAAPLTVSYAIRGSATNGFDYVQLPGTVTIPARKKSAKVTIQLVDDPFHESTETLVVAVLPGPESTESSAPPVRIAIVDDD